MNITSRFIELVKIDSPSGNEEAMSIHLQTWLIKHNFECKVDRVGNIYAINKKVGVPLLICAHMDTVQPGENIHPLIKNGIVKSDGKTILGADNKATIAAIMTAVEKNNNRHLELLFTVKEETGGGVEHFPFDWIHSKKGLIFDSTHPLGGIILQSPYICNFNAVLLGKAAHASRPQEGINVLNPASQALQQIKVGSLDKDETTINIGLVKGGTGINTIPDEFLISGEVRSYSQKLFKKHLNHIENMFKKEIINSKVKLKFTLDGYCPGYTHTKKSAFIAQIDAIYRSLELKTMYYERSGISDANILNKHGILTVNLTDGVSKPHTKEEHITVKNLVMLSQIVASCINEL